MPDLAEKFTNADWARILDAYVAFVLQTKWVADEVRDREERRD